MYSSKSSSAIVRFSTRQILLVPIFKPSLCAFIMSRGYEFRELPPGRIWPEGFRLGNTSLHRLCACKCFQDLRVNGWSLVVTHTRVHWLVGQVLGEQFVQSSHVGHLLSAALAPDVVGWDVAGHNYEVKLKNTRWEKIFLKK